MQAFKFVLNLRQIPMCVGVTHVELNLHYNTLESVEPLDSPQTTSRQTHAFYTLDIHT